MGAAIWKGYIHFGDIDVPVKLHSAVKEERTQFHLLHRRDQVRLRQQMVCTYDKQPVPAEEQARGFEVEEGKYVLMEPEELEQTVPDNSRMIEVHEFVERAQIDPAFVERVYYLEPDPAALQPRGYSALVRALNGMDGAGICTWTMRKRSYFGAVLAVGGVLRLSTLRYADELVSVASLGLQSTALSEKELAIGIELIGKLTEPFEPQKFADEHEKKLQDLIEKKARGEEIAALSPRQLKPTQPDQLLQALEASLKKAA